MSLLFVLLREDHIIFAADSRHTRGDRLGSYRTDDGFKSEIILNGAAVFGLAGVDAGESIFASFKQGGGFHKSGMAEVALLLSLHAATKYKELVPFDYWQTRTVQFLMAGFETDCDKQLVAKVYSFASPDFGPFEFIYPYRTFEVIGRGTHGALYALHRFNAAASELAAGLRLSCFIMHEICECDPTVGGKPLVYVLRPNQPAEKQPEDSYDCSWAADLGKQIEQAIVSPNSQLKVRPRPKRGQSNRPPSRE